MKVKLVLSGDEFIQLHQIKDTGHSEMVKVPRQALEHILMDHSELLSNQK